MTYIKTATHRNPLQCNPAAGGCAGVPPVGGETHRRATPRAGKGHGKGFSLP